MNFEREQHTYRSPEIYDAIKQQLAKRVEDRLRTMINKKIEDWYDSRIERHRDMLQKEADRLFSMILEGRSSGRSIEEEPKNSAKKLVSEMDFD